MFLAPADTTQTRQYVAWPNVKGAAIPLSVHHWQQANNKPLIVICESAAQAFNLREELSWLANDNYPVIDFPDWETLPYDQFSPHQDIISDRIRALLQLPNMSNGILTLPISTLFNRLTPTDFIPARSFAINVGESLNTEEFTQRLVKAGYRVTDTVRDHGEIALRGSIVDVFPMGTDTPYRIDLFDDEIEEIRIFNPETQRTTAKADAIELLPAQEVPVDRNHRLIFEEKWHESFSADHTLVPMYEDILKGISPAGIEYFLPLFFDEDSASLFDYLPEQCTLLCLGDINRASDQHWRDINNRYEQFRGDIQRPLLAPHHAFFTVDQIMGAIKQHPRYQHTYQGLVDSVVYDVSIDGRLEDPLERYKNFLVAHKHRTILAADSLGQRELLTEQLKRSNVEYQLIDRIEDAKGDVRTSVIVAPFNSGLVDDQHELAIFTDNELYGRRIKQRRRRQQATADNEFVIRDLSQLVADSPVVHIEHGIGRYRGLELIAFGDETAEFVTLEYAGGAKLYVPVASLHVISRYTGADPDTAPLHKLGSDTWSNAKQKAAEKARDAAAELLDIYARREAKKGNKFEIATEDLRKFSAEFPFEETPDQTKAIHAVISDMRSDKAMDRLVCGDVGFGKTEVAMRACFTAVMGGKQVGVLVPTTLLAQQHYQNFIDRFKDWPVKVEVISRFKTDKEVKQITKQLEDGNIDILIGTHKLIQTGFNFNDLGLLVIDEEHRFGVRQKEKIKALRSEIDILTMTATPIPRTLNLAMHGMRDLSIIATPPAKRLKINTFVREQDDNLIKEAVLREILRGGQVYYLHNDLATIERTAEHLQELIPEARIGIGHGQMRERELEQVMGDFYHRRTNILVCSTIIETGIDVPNANTIIIDRADKFGIAQLHQLRGRVGRSHHQAYAYLLTPPWKGLKKDAQKRLEAISTTAELGAGFTLATHDLEIRGAGELLGDNQSGQIHTVGFSMYMELLDQAIADIKSGKSTPSEHAFELKGEIDLGIAALIPDDFIGDVNERLVLYKRISNAATKAQLKDLKVEIIDRFGLFPVQVENLFVANRLRQKCQTIGIKKLVSSATGGKIIFSSDTQVEPMKLVTLVQQQHRIFKLQGANELRFTLPLEDKEKRVEWINQLVDNLSPEKD